MAFDLNPFLTNISNYGFTSANKFDVSITSPLAFSTNQFTMQVPNILQFRAEKVTAPSVTFLSNESNQYGSGPLIKQPYTAAFGDIQMTFLADKQGLIYWYFYEWMNIIYNFSDLYVDGGVSDFGVNANTTNYNAATYTTAFEDDYISPQITINYYDNAGNNYQKINAYSAKPVILTSMPLSWDAQNQAFKIYVVFTYKQWSLALPNISNN